MIDIHSHLIYGVDDGCKTISESIELIETLNNIGFDDLIITPHLTKKVNKVEFLIQMGNL